MSEIWTNNASSTLATGINNSVTSLDVASGEGAKFPSPSGGDYFYAFLKEGTTVEVVKVTARSSDTFTIVRAQQGSSAASFTNAATVKHGASKDAFNRWEALLGATQTANRVFAGPASGSAAMPTFRALVQADIAGLGGRVLLESHTASASVTLPFTTRNAPGQSGATIQSDYDEYVIELLNVLPATNSVSVQLQFSTDGGSSWITSAYRYGLRYNGTNSDTGIQGSGSNAAVNLSNSCSNGSNFGLTGHVELYAPQDAPYKKMKFGMAHIADNSVLYSVDGAGMYDSNSTSINAFRLLCSSGNIASGTVRVYGIVK